MMDRFNPKIVLVFVILDVFVAATGTIVLLFGPTEYRSDVAGLTIRTWLLGAGASILYRYLRSRQAKER
jgi:hypothetical protein